MLQENDRKKTEQRVQKNAHVCIIAQRYLLK